MRAFLIVFAVVVLFALTALGVVAWKLSHLKQELADDLEAQLHATAHITSLDFDFGKSEIHAAGISLENQRPESPWETASVDQATIHFKFSDLFASVLPLQIEVVGWKVNLHTTTQAFAPGSITPGATTPAPDATSSAGEASPAPASNGQPDRVRVNSLTAKEGDVAIVVAGNQTITIHGVSFKAENHGGSQWTTDLQASSVNTGTLTTGSGSVQLISEGEKVSFDKLTVHCGDGQVMGSGEIGLAGNHPVHGAFTADAVPITMLVATRWQMKVAGLISGNLTYQSDDTSASAMGKISTSQGRFSLFPWMGKVTLLVGLPDVSNLDVDVATCDLVWKDHLLTLQNIDVRKMGVIRLAGQMTVAADGTCDGQLKLGLPAEVVARWPRLQTEIFTQQLENYNWTDVHVTGQPDHLQEDLSPRLVTVGAEQGADLLKQSGQKASDFLNSLLK